MYFVALVDPTPMENLLSTITTVLTSIISWVTSVMSMIMNNPLILLFVVIGVGLIAVGVVRRLIRL